MLVVASLAVIAVMYAIYQWQDDTLPIVARPEPAPLPPRLAGPTTTQPGGPTSPALSIRGGLLTDGDAPVLRVYDKEGKTRIAFEATKFDAVSDTEFELVEPTVRLALAGGELAYIWADEGRVTVLQGEDDKPNPKRGQLRGNVRLFIDMTTEAWRADHPDRAALDQHPEAVVKLWLDHVRFDLDLSYLDSDGPILLQSSYGDLEGKGLTIVWNELERRIQQLVIAQGRRAVLRNAELPGVGAARARSSRSAASAPEVRAKPVASAPASPPEPRVARIVQPSEPGALPYIDLGGRKGPSIEPRVETYRILFRDRVTAAQKQGGRVVGEMTGADTLEALFDFTPAERSPSAQATKEAAEKPATSPASKPAPAQPFGSAIELTWTGRLEITPAPQDAGHAAAANRAHLIVRGSPFEMYVPGSGKGACLELEYHDETQQVWLRGSQDQPVVLPLDEQRQLVAFGTVHADQKKGTARVDSPGRLISRGPDERESEPSDGDWLGGRGARNMEISWNGSVNLEFAKGTASQPAASMPTDLSPVPKGAYLKQAVLVDGATFSDERSSIRADRIEVRFAEPGKAGQPAAPMEKMAVEHMTALGHVVMTIRRKETVETVECDRMEVEVAPDEAGEPVPRMARAIGHVVAREKGRLARWGPGSLRDVVLREIRAKDELILDMASIPVPVSPEEVARIEAKAAKAREKAKERNIVEGSVEWKQYEEQIRRRLQPRKTVATRLRASGRVTVVDLKQELDLAADSIDCELGRDREEIRKAVIVGSEAQTARVEIGDFFIRGPLIDVDVPTQSARVPGAGTMKFLTRQDLDGRAVDKAIPVVLSWQKEMTLAGDRNAGRVVGKVQAVSETVMLRCDDEMLLTFTDFNPPAAVATGPAVRKPRWILTMIGELVSPPVKAPTEKRADRRIRKRLASLEAVGSAAVEASVRLEGTGRETIIENWLESANQTLASLLPASGEPAPPPADRTKRLASRVLVVGPRIFVRLDERQMNVDGGGHLLVEDYQLRKVRRGGARPDGQASLLDGASLGSLEGLGPNQTSFTWLNSMSFHNNRNTAVFDSGVEMQHRSGAKLLELERVAKAMAVDPQVLRDMPGRVASLNCDRFTVEFERDKAIGTGQPAPLSRATRLKGFWAAGQQVRLEESGRFVEGTDVSYDSATQIGRVQGSQVFPAKLGVVDARTGIPDTIRVEQFKWDQRTGIIELRDPRLRATGK